MNLMYFNNNNKIKYTEKRTLITNNPNKHFL